jgi:small-conductance mechanosensitive channel
MIDWIETCLFGAALVFLICAVTPRLRAYRSLFLGGFVLMLSTALFRRRDNLLGKYLFNGATGTIQLPAELFGIAWWILGAWLVRSLLTLILRRTLFPNDNQPHARRLFADLASGLVYVVAFVGIMDTVLKQPISTVLATSGVLAIVLGLALQNTLADVFSGLAINVERPFGAGDWITMPDHVEGQVIEINWRATRIKTSSNDIVVIPNSVIAKAVVTNHRRLNDPHLCTLRVKVDHTVPPTRVIDTLQAAARGSAGISPDISPVASACEIIDALVAYEIYFGVDDFALAPTVQSEVLRRVVDAFLVAGIPIGTATMDVRVVRNGTDPDSKRVAAYVDPGTSAS